MKAIEIQGHLYDRNTACNFSSVVGIFNGFLWILLNLLSKSELMSEMFMVFLIQQNCLLLVNNLYQNYSDRLIVHCLKIITFFFFLFYTCFMLIYSKFPLELRVLISASLAASSVVFSVLSRLHFGEKICKLAFASLCYFTTGYFSLSCCYIAMYSIHFFLCNTLWLNFFIRFCSSFQSFFLTTHDLSCHQGRFSFSLFLLFQKSTWAR